MANTAEQQAPRTQPLRVLFLCTHNSSRSQMAEGLLRARGGTRYQVFSAGTHPRSAHPFAVKALAELGIDISEAAGHRAKGIEEFTDQPPMDLVITVCDEAAEECPYFPRARRQEHWGFPDPSRAIGSEEERLAVFHQVRDAIAARIDAFLRDDMGEDKRLTRLLILGGSDAGTSAALRARELDSTAEVSVVLADRFPNYSICGLPSTSAAKHPIGTGWPIERRKTSPARGSTCSLSTRPRPSTLPTTWSGSSTGVGGRASSRMIAWSSPPVRYPFVLPLQASTSPVSFSYEGWRTVSPSRHGWRLMRRAQP